MSTKLQLSNRIGKELFTKIEELTEERVLKDMAMSIIRDMPIDQVLRVFNLEKMDPESPEMKEWAEENPVPSPTRSKYLELRDKGQVEYILSIVVRDAYTKDTRDKGEGL